MPSRKRSKGQARKANAAAARGTAPNAKDRGNGSDGERDRLNREKEQMALSERVGNLSIGEERCYHGFTPPLPRVFCRWIVAFEGAMQVADQSVGGIVVDVVMSSQIAFGVDSPAWDDPSLVERFRSFLVSVGTDRLLKGLTGQAVCYALAIFMVENPEGSQTPIENIACLARDMLHDKEGDAIRFYRKRVGCSCLKEKYAVLKNKPRMGTCSYCHKEMRRSQLMLCQKCKILQYCSKECQRLDWPTHKDFCCKVSLDDVYVRVRALNESTNTMNGQS